MWSGPAQMVAWLQATLAYYYSEVKVPELKEGFI